MMFEWIVNKIINFLGLMLQGISWVITFLANHLWALFSFVFGVVCSLWTALVDTVSGWINKLVDPVSISSDLNFGSSLSDTVDKVIISNLGNDALSTVCKDLIYGFNIGAFFTALIGIFIPVVLSIFIYRLVKSWIPTVSG